MFVDPIHTHIHLLWSLELTSCYFDCHSKLHTIISWISRLGARLWIGFIPHPPHSSRDLLPGFKELSPCRITPALMMRRRNISQIYRRCSSSLWTRSTKSSLSSSAHIALLRIDFQLQLAGRNGMGVETSMFKLVQLCSITDFGFWLNCRCKNCTIYFQILSVRVE